MPFVRRKRGQVLIVHNRRTDDGAVRQDVLHTFRSPEELEALFSGDGWSRWTNEMAWRHQELDWEWPALRVKLTDALREWEEQPTGAVHRRKQKVQRLAAELDKTLRGLSPARKADAALLRDTHKELVELEGTLSVLLARAAGKQDDEERKIKMQVIKNETTEAGGSQHAEQIFDEGMEFWWAGDRATACRSFRRALKSDPQHADAHNHLGIAAMDSGKWKEAERLFSRAIEFAKKQIIRDGKRIEWGHLENRLYLRPLANLALLHRRRGDHRAALEIHQEIVCVNPNDNQGVRSLIPQELHRLGEIDKAITAYRKALEFQESNFGLALALLTRGQEKQAAIALLNGIAANRYVAPMLLGEKWQKLDGFHGTNMAEPEWAADYVDHDSDLWVHYPEASKFLRFWNSSSIIRRWREELDEIIVGLGTAQDDRRQRLIARKLELESDRSIRKLVDALMGSS